MVFFEQASRIHEQDLVDNGFFITVCCIACRQTNTQLNKGCETDNPFSRRNHILHSIARSLAPSVVHRGFPCTKHTYTLVINRMHNNDDGKDQGLLMHAANTRTQSQMMENAFCVQYEQFARFCCFLFALCDRVSVSK